MLFRSHFKAVPPGSTRIHYNETGFFKAVYEKETQVLDAIKEWMTYLPAYNPRFFRVAEPAEPKLSPADLSSIVPINTKRVYSFEEVLARIPDIRLAEDGPLERRPNNFITGIEKMPVVFTPSRASA